LPRGMPALAGRGRKSGTAIEGKPVEAQPVFGQISPLKRPDGSGLAGGKSQGDLETSVCSETAARRSGGFPCSSVGYDHYCSSGLPVARMLTNGTGANAGRFGAESSNLAGKILEFASRRSGFRIVLTEP